MIDQAAKLCAGSLQILMPSVCLTWFNSFKRPEAAANGNRCALGCVACCFALVNNRSLLLFLIDSPLLSSPTTIQMKDRWIL